jgi:hypothetical protein
MAALPTTLPAPPTGLGADSTAQQEYFAALDRTLQALEGSFGEAVGRVATGVGEDLQRQAEMELPIAQVRAQLAGQKFQVANEAKALDLVSSVLGTSPAQTNAVISSGQLPSDMVSKITPGLVIAVNKLDPKLGASLKQVFDMDVKRRELVNDDIKNGLSVSDLIIKYGPGVTQYLPSGAPLPGGGRAGTSPVRPSVAPVSEVPTTTPETTTTQTAPTTQTTQPRPVAQPVSATIPDSGLPLAVQADVMRGRATELDKPWTEQRVAINAWTPAAVGNSDRVLRELYKIANEKGHIFGLMQKEGLLSAALNAGQEGLQIGRVGSVSLPVQTVVQKLKLSETDQAFLRRATQLMAEQFFENAKANKSILGPQISNADAQFMQRPMVTEADSAANIKYWVQQHVLINKQRGELFKSLNTFDQRMGPRVPAGQYFSSPDYYNIVEKYNELNRQLIERSPFYRQ